MVYVAIVREQNQRDNVREIKSLLGTCGYHYTEYNFKKDTSISDRIRKCLSSVRKFYDGPVFVISSKMISLAAGKRIKSMIAGGLEAEEDIDVLYLAKHNDYCQKIRPSKKNEFHKTYHPCGLDAVVYTPQGIEKILGERQLSDYDIYIDEDDDLIEVLPELIHDGHIKALSTNINLFEYDIYDHANTTNDFEKWNKCAPLQRMPPKVERTGISGVVYLFLIVVIVLMVAWALIYLGPRG